METIKILEGQKENICEAMNIKKKRRCKFEKVKGQKFCHHHYEADERIPCPLDPKHTVLQSKLDSHLKKCDIVRLQKFKENTDWFQQDVNEEILKQKNAQEQPLKKEEKVSYKLKRLQIEKSKFLMDILIKIPQLFDRAVEIYCNQIKQDSKSFRESLLGFDIVEKDKKQFEQEKDLVNSENKKDILQVKLLVNYLKSKNMIHSNFCYVEFGAGKGLLSHGIAIQVLEDIQNSNPDLIQLKNNEFIGVNGQKHLRNHQIEDHFKRKQIQLKDEQLYSSHILIERESRQKKLDGIHKDNPFYFRFLTDIKDFNSQKIVPMLEQKGKKNADHVKTIGVCKHMCGPGSDISLQSLKAFPKQQFGGILMATCCHHLCNQTLYVNNNFLKQIGLNDEEIDYFFACSSWFISGQIPGQNNKQPQNLQKFNQDEILRKRPQNNIDIFEEYENIQKKVKLEEESKKFIDESQELFYQDLSSQKRTLFGKMVKRITDIGRTIYMRELGFDIRLEKFCEEVVTPENFIIVGNNSLI